MYIWVYMVYPMVGYTMSRGHGIPPTAVTSAERFHINHVASATRALICLVTLPFDLLTLESGEHYCPWGGQPSYQFGVYGAFLLDSWAETHQVTTRPWPLTFWPRLHLPILGFLGLSVLELGQSTRQTDRGIDRQTDTAPHFIMPPPMEVGGIIIIIIIKIVCKVHMDIGLRYI